jgi:hypothetical protein
MITSSERHLYRIHRHCCRCSVLVAADRWPRLHCISTENRQNPSKTNNLSNYLKFYKIKTINFKIRCYLFTNHGFLNF